MREFYTSCFKITPIESETCPSENSEGPLILIKISHKHLYIQYLLSKVVGQRKIARIGDKNESNRKSSFYGYR